ncbi:uncharacterized protein LOC106087279 [Stomoxys calcitrans]|uniref:uncharacterized protein LOC106087279 n=1 Tax=Stomoxys calcitrans TaxID=35570 RepID=UPI0027E324DC|nr:uncharacterized protein LOC106087279 [Stomoxys calcitrans]
MSKDTAYNIPSWVKPELFTNVLKDNLKDFKEIKQFKVCPALAPGENYATVMLKVHMECLLNGGHMEKYTLMLKVPHDNDLYRNELVKWDMFATEAGMYREIVPAFEKLYGDKGVAIRFGANAYELPVKEEYILLEDLCVRGFRNVKRQNCLDEDHCKSVLKKMAQFHAASAVWVQNNGPLPQLYQKGMLREEGKGLLEPMLKDGLKHILNSTKKLKNCQNLHPQLKVFSENFVKVIFAEVKAKESDFNVLNHGDCWANNIMFRYDEQGKLLENYFVDFQMPSYGSPAQDLLYFMMSSAQLDLKVNRFDEMMRYYHENLTHHLKLLGYRKRMPSLKDLHQMIIRGGIWGIVTIVITMAAVLCDGTNEASIDNFVSDSEQSQKFKELLYSNDRFLQHLQVVLPWLCNRGALEI